VITDKEIQILDGMIVAGYMVMLIPNATSQPSVTYGVFKTTEDASKWANKLEGIVSIHPIYEPITSRG
jgi:hypothetical protein